MEWNDVEKMYIIAKRVYKREHVKKTVEGIAIEQIVKGCCRDYLWITIDTFDCRIEAMRKLNKSDISKLVQILQVVNCLWSFPEKTF